MAKHNATTVVVVLLKRELGNTKNMHMHILPCKVLHLARHLVGSVILLQQFFTSQQMSKARDIEKTRRHDDVRHFASEVMQYVV